MQQSSAVQPNLHTHMKGTLPPALALTIGISHKSWGTEASSMDVTPKESYRYCRQRLGVGEVSGAEVWAYLSEVFPIPSSPWPL